MKKSVVLAAGAYPCGGVRARPSPPAADGAGLRPASVELRRGARRDLCRLRQRAPADRANGRVGPADRTPAGRCRLEPRFRAGTDAVADRARAALLTWARLAGRAAALSLLRATRP